MAGEQAAFANLERSRRNVDEARGRLHAFQHAFQNVNSLLDPAANAETTQRMVAELERQLAARDVALSTGAQPC